MSRYSKRWWKARLVPVAFLALAAMASIAIWRVEQLGKQGRLDLCHAINRDRAIDRATLERSIEDTRRLVGIPGYGPAMRQRAIGRLRGEIAAREPLPCDRIEDGEDVDEPPANLPDTGG